VTGPRNETALAREGEEAGIEPHQVAFVLGDGRGEIIEPQFPRAATQGLEGMHVTTHESFETLAVRELQVHLAAMAFHQAEGV
jgi:hypothetical protein